MPMPTVGAWGTFGPRGLGMAALGTAMGLSEYYAKKAGPGVAGRAAGYASRGLGWASKNMSPNALLTASSALGGATLGGAYGAVSDDTSVLGGAFKGALTGATLSRAALAGEYLYGVGATAAAGVQGGFSQRAMAAAKAIGSVSRDYIAGTWGRAYNGIKGLRGPSGNLEYYI